MRYRIVRSGNGFTTQCMFLFMWGDVFVLGHNYFKTVEEAELAIRQADNRRRTNGLVVKQFDL